MAASASVELDAAEQEELHETFSQLGLVAAADAADETPAGGGRGAGAATTPAAGRSRRPAARRRATRCPGVPADDE